MAVTALFVLHWLRDTREAQDTYKHVHATLTLLFPETDVVSQGPQSVLGKKGRKPHLWDFKSIGVHLEQSRPSLHPYGTKLWPQSHRINKCSGRGWQLPPQGHRFRNGPRRMYSLSQGRGQGKDEILPEEDRLQPGQSQ